MHDFPFICIFICNINKNYKRVSVLSAVFRKSNEFFINTSLIRVMIFHLISFKYIINWAKFNKTIRMRPMKI